MYVGRIVSVSITPVGQLCASYRVSSRSFPNRTAVVGPDKVSIVPKKGYEGDIHKNPYIAYNCARIVAGGAVAVVTNGSQTDPIAEKIDMGMNVRDALALSHMALDYEKDDYNTPRISAVADTRDGGLWLAVVRDDGLNVRRYALEAGQHAYVTTYEENDLSPSQSGDYDAGTADEACTFVLEKGIFAERTNPVTAVAAVWDGSAFSLAARDAS